MRAPTKVLIVEVDKELAELERMILEDAGFHAIPTVCSPTSMHEVRKVNPDAIVLDLGYANKTCGWQLLSELGSRPDTQGIPVLVISRDAERIMAEWLRRAQQQRALGPRPNVLVRLLMNNISVWLIGLVSVLRYGPGHLGTAEIHDKLAEHIRKAADQGLTLAETIRQFDILRDVVWETLKHSSLADLTTQDVFALAQTVNTALDKVLAQVAEEYGK